jgi:hypothetical protein
MALHRIRRKLGVTAWEALTTGWSIIFLMAAVPSLIAAIVVWTLRKFSGVGASMAAGGAIAGLLFFQSRPAFEIAHSYIPPSGMLHETITCACPRILGWIAFNTYSDDYFGFYRDCFAAPIAIAMIGTLVVAALYRVSETQGPTSI